MKLYTFNNGSTISFRGADDSESLRGAPSDIAFINEANTISEESYNQIKMRTSFLTILDLNPSHASYIEEKVMPSALVSHTTFADNLAHYPGSSNCYLICHSLDKNVQVVA